MNPAVSEDVSRPETMVVDARDSPGACDSKAARKRALFSCPEAVGCTGDCDVLAVEERVEGCEMGSLKVGGLA